MGCIALSDPESLPGICTFLQEPVTSGILARAQNLVQLKSRQSGGGVASKAEDESTKGEGDPSQGSGPSRCSFLPTRRKILWFQSTAPI